METAALAEVRSEIESLYLERGDGYDALPTRYRALLALESSLLARQRGRELRRAIDEGKVVGYRSSSYWSASHAHPA